MTDLDFGPCTAMTANFSWRFVIVIPVGTTAIKAATTSDVLEALGIRNKSVGLFR